MSISLLLRRRRPITAPSNRVTCRTCGSAAIVFAGAPSVMVFDPSPRPADTLADPATGGQLRFWLALRLDPVLDAQQHSACHQRLDRAGGLEAEHFNRVV